MISIKRSSIFVLGLSLASTPAFAADTGLSPSSVKVTVYSVAVSTNADCSSAKVVASYASGKEFDFMATPAPSLFTGTLANGSYACVILQMSDQVKFTPSTTSTSGHCVSGTSVTTPVCNSANSQKYQPMTVNSDNTVTFGALQTCTAATGNAGETVALFLSTSSTGTTGVLAPFVQPATANASNCSGSVATGCGIKLSSAFTVNGTASGTFVVNFTGQIQDQGGVCGLNAPTFTFR